MAALGPCWQRPELRALLRQCSCLRISVAVAMFTHFSSCGVVDAVAMPGLSVTVADIPSKAEVVTASKAAEGKKWQRTPSAAKGNKLGLAALPVASSGEPQAPELLPGVAAVMGSSMKAFQTLVQALTEDAEQLQAQTQALRVGGLAELAQKKIELEQTLERQKNASAALVARNAEVQKHIMKLEGDNRGYELEASRLHDENARMAQQLHLAQAASHNETLGAAIDSSNHDIANRSGNGIGTVHDGQEKDSGGSDHGDDKEGDAAEEVGDEADDDSADLDAATEAAVAAAPAVQAAIGMDASAPKGGSGSASGGEVIADPAADEANGAAEDGPAGGGLGVLSFATMAQEVGTEVVTGSTVSVSTAIDINTGSSVAPRSQVTLAGADVGGALGSISADPQVIVKHLRSFGQDISQVLSLERQGEDKFQAAFEAKFAEGKRQQKKLQDEFRKLKNRESSLQASQKELLELVKTRRRERDKMRGIVADVRQQLLEQQEAIATLLSIDGTSARVAMPITAASSAAGSQ
eukprot:CAMPEP_0115233396 /NCGR_PEP_ID=MMETSP0270-20121206/34254_1 /TAXON_ID=71861 /ORGANISM="Scrippsiella trochoidea, Strain CCMP3099" /LENGTH=523 /DNA_ID=CAMNT_0002648107 /DNA_START=42 /DNA_END=1610 /DNA_ORIENTATION=+